MNYKSVIDECYSQLKLVPINGQEYAIDKILTAFFIGNKSNVILQADTGTGKSIIAAVVAKAFSILKESSLNADTLPASIVVHSNTLVKQYGKTFERFKSSEFHQIIGASNYKCLAGNFLSTEKTPDYRGDQCFFNKAEAPIVNQYCNVCDYKVAKSYINATDVLITNYSYHFISSMWTHHLKRRLLTVFDEAHTINDVFCEHNAIYISVDRLAKYIEECKDNYPSELKEEIRYFHRLKQDMLDNKISEANYVSMIKELSRNYTSVAKCFSSKNDSSKLDEYLKLNKIGKKYADLACKIGDLISYKYDHVFEVNDSDISIKSIFVGEMSSQIMSEYNLFMSATISDEFMIQTLSLSREDTAFIKLDPVYDPENKPILFCGRYKLNYSAMNDSDIVENLRLSVHAIVDQAKTDNDKGIMLTPSFKVGEQLTKGFPRHTKLFLHKAGVDVNKLISDFKEYSGAALLVSPSIYEGLSFDDDLSRYQILVKAPYPSLGEKRMEYIANNYPDVYKIITLKKIIQGIGRSIRNKDDYAVTFVMDKNIEHLFFSKYNVWKNQFKIL